jgi:nucleotide-binding universal stress UspA family protein
MRILIGYDGSDHANIAIDELSRAGVPDGSEVYVVTVADVWPNLPASAFEVTDPARLAGMSPMVRRAHELAASAMRDARATAEQGAARVRERCSHVIASTDACAGSSSMSLVEYARNKKVDLIVVGAHGKGAIMRALLGSVSQSVLTHATCSVRVARAPRRGAAEPVRLIVGLDGSPNAAAALHALTLRKWPAGTEVRVVVALDVRLATALPQIAGESSWPPPVDPQSQDWPRHAAEAAVAELHRAGLSAVPIVRDGDPKHILIEEAETWQADCIFVGARGLSRMEGFLLGSVSSAVAARASCSVEVVRFE